MPFEVKWHTDKRIILQRFYGRVTLEDVREAVNANDGFIEQGIAPIHLIVDAADIDNIPVHLRETSKISSNLNDPSVGWVILITNNPLSEFFVKLTSQLVKYRLGRAKSLEEALEFLARQDSTLPILGE